MRIIFCRARLKFNNLFLCIIAHCIYLEV
uniref:Uncharacterized protein n=1 Tax=Rhizophora mucronata TaxID=61149 RepID=A0A2P2QFK4_RHIMU